MINRFLKCLVITALTLNYAALAFADETQCRPGEYVMTISSVNHLKQKVIDEVADSSDKPIAIAEESKRAILVKVFDPVAYGTKNLTSSEKDNRLCKNIKRGYRAKKRQRAKSGDQSIIRDISCSCNGIVHATAAPNDPYYANQQWGLNQVNNIDIDAPEAWDRVSNPSNVVVAVIDTGILYTHPDLSPRMWQNPWEIAGNGIDDDQNGYIDDIHGINSINDSGNPFDDNGHGTHCAGVIGAATNNGIGMAGVNPGANISLIGVKFLSASGSGSYYDAIQSIDYVTSLKQRGVNIILSSNSWGSQGDTWGPLGDAIMRGQNAGVMFIAAAGNNGANTDVTPFNPSGFGADSVVSVAAIDKYGALASFSNYGATKVDIGAPGVSILSTYTSTSYPYQYLNGTSMATPFVSGAIAFVAAAVPGITWQQLKQLLLSSGKPLASLSDKTVSGKMLNLNNFIMAAQGLNIPTPTPTPSPTMTRTPGPTPTSTNTPTPTSTPTLAPGYWNVNGTVTGNGTPIANAVVRLVSITGTSSRMTDSAGRYSFTSIYTSPSITVSVEAAGYVFSPVTSTLGANRTIDLAGVAQQFTLMAWVRDENGNGVPGVSVDGGTLGNNVTNAQGYASFQAIYGTQYTLRATGTQTHLIPDPNRSGTLYGHTSRVWVAETP